MALPNFFLIGAAKAGTTTLHHVLSSHPEIFMSPIKETNFFSRHDMQPEHFLSRYKRSIDLDLDDYLNLQSRPNRHIAHVEDELHYLKLFDDSRTNQSTAIGEASNSYLFCPNTATEIKKAVNAPKFLIILRNPVERAWSHYSMNLMLGYEMKQDFISEFRSDSGRPIQGWGVSHNYRELGLYSSQISRYLRVFPRSSIFVCLFEDLIQSPKKLFSEIFEFLGVTPEHSIATHLAKKNEGIVPKFPRIHQALSSRKMLLTLYRSNPKLFQPIMKLLSTNSNTKPLQPRLEEVIFLAKVYEEEITNTESIIGRNLDQWRDISRYLNPGA